MVRLNMRAGTCSRICVVACLRCRVFACWRAGVLAYSRVRGFACLVCGGGGGGGGGRGGSGGSCGCINTRLFAPFRPVGDERTQEILRAQVRAFDSEVAWDADDRHLAAGGPSISPVSIRAHERACPWARKGKHPDECRDRDRLELRVQVATMQVAANPIRDHHEPGQARRQRPTDRLSVDEHGLGLNRAALGPVVVVSLVPGAGREE